jgi:C4-dicarboxylate-specific signal transduction histidine kinase
MAYSVVDRSPVALTAFAARYHPNLPPDIIPDKTTWAWAPAEAAGCDSEQPCHEIQAEAHANRIAILGQLSMSIAHEINQPISAVVTNAQVALRLLSAEPTNMEPVRLALTRIVRDAQRAGNIVGRTRALIKKAPPRMQSLELNEAILEAIGVTHGEAVMNGVSVRTKLAEHLPLVRGDRIQLQQVMLNLIVNAVEAMSADVAGTRDLMISSAKTKSGGVLVAVQDSGPGVKPADLERIFETFYTTKADGLGMGLSICRAIIERHGGELWATRAAPRGTIFQLTLPASMDRAS